MTQFRGSLETTPEYNEFLLAFNKYREHHGVKSYIDMAEIKRFLPTLGLPTVKLKSLYESIEHAVLYDVFPVKDDLRLKEKDPDLVIEAQWSNYLRHVSERFTEQLQLLPEEIRLRFLESTAAGVSRDIIQYTFKAVYPGRDLPDSIFNRLRCVAFHELLRFHYPQLRDEPMPRMVSWGEQNTINWLKKNKVKLKKQHQDIIDSLERTKIHKAITAQLAYNNNTNNYLEPNFESSKQQKKNLGQRSAEKKKLAISYEKRRSRSISSLTTRSKSRSTTFSRSYSRSRSRSKYSSNLGSPLRSKHQPLQQKNLLSSHSAKHLALCNGNKNERILAGSRLKSSSCSTTNSPPRFKSSSRSHSKSQLFPLKLPRSELSADSGIEDQSFSTSLADQTKEELFADRQYLK